MTKQVELKKQAYASNLKSRALLVLLYLIDRSNKELTCFPAIPTMAGQLHISVSTVKRALHELVEAGYVKKDSRFRENNKGQTSNLYTLVLFERHQAVADGRSYDNGASHPGNRDNTELRGSVVETGESHVEHVDFDLLKVWAETEGVSEPEDGDNRETGDAEDTVLRDEKINNGGRDIMLAPVHACGKPYAGKDMIDIIYDKTKTELSEKAGDFRSGSHLLFLWTGEGFSLMPP